MNTSYVSTPNSLGSPITHGYKIILFNSHLHNKEKRKTRKNISRMMEMLVKLLDSSFPIRNSCRVK